uniref:Uncharacterized protein n=1 Tax=Arundo donax TaxID=35708 RepID=A0A0A9C4A7_ARUDO
MRKSYIVAMVQKNS